MSFMVNPFTFGDPRFAEVQVHLHMDGTDGSTTFTDSSPAGHTVTANGDAQIDTARVKFGTGAGLFDGTGDYLSISGLTAAGTGDVTYEQWCYHTDGTSTYRGAFDSRSAGATADGYGVYFVGTTIEIYAAGLVFSATSAVPTNTWFHLAVVRTGGDMMVFVDGTQVGSTTADSTNLSNATLRVASDATTLAFVGSLDEVRVTNAAWYTGNFTPSASAFPDA